VPWEWDPSLLNDFFILIFFSPSFYLLLISFVYPNIF
jgi:hypothetical protein